MPITPVVKQLLILNVIVFIAANTLVPLAYDLFPIYFPLNESFKFWQPLTHMFMHAKLNENLMHIVFNMFGIYMFGSAVEQYMGGKKFLFFYISCGFGAALLHIGIDYYTFQKTYNLLVNNGINTKEIQTILASGNYNTAILEYVSSDQLSEFYRAYDTRAVGASGALYGVLAAFALLFPQVELMLLFLPIPIKAKYFVPLLVAGDLFMGIRGTSLFGGGGIAHFAHVGGAVTGFLMAWYWKKNQFERNRWY